MIAHCMQHLVTTRDVILHTIGFICAMGFLIGIPAGIIYLYANSPPLSDITCVYAPHASTSVCGTELPR